MPSPDYSYLWEKFMLAVTGMAKSSSSIQQRIAYAYLDHMLGLIPRHFPDDLWQEFDRIERKLTSETPVGNEGAVQATVSSMSEEMASDIAKEIVNLFGEIDNRYHELLIQRRPPEIGGHLRIVPKPPP